jgi:hypothetical protein
MAEGNQPAKKPKSKSEPSRIENASLLTVVAWSAIGTLLVGIAFYLVFIHSLGVAEWWWVWDPHLTSDDLFSVLRSTVAATAVLAGAIATVVALRRQLATERKLDLDRDASRLAVEQDRRTRYVKSVELLGHESPTIRLGGVYSLEELSIEWTDLGQRQMCVDVLCSYLRMPPGTENGPTEDEKVVRAAIEAVIFRHVKRDSDMHWGPVAVDLNGATLIGALPLAGLNFLGDVDFGGCTFMENPKFRDAEFHGEVNFSAARFPSGLALFDVRFHQKLYLMEVEVAKEVLFSRVTLDDGLSVEYSKFA